MTIKEKIRILSDVKKANEQRLKAWMEERTADHGNDSDR